MREKRFGLNQGQITNLFKRDRTVITKHINNIFSEQELEQESNMQKMHIANSDRPVAFYSLDVIISIGYRVKSKEGTQFRIWANQVLKEYLIKGYAINETRLREQAKQLESLKNTVSMLSKALESKELSTDEATDLLKVVTDYAYALDILDKYDHQQLTIEGTTSKSLFIIDYQDAIP